MRKIGQFTFFSADRGYGVLRVGPPESLERYFVHTRFLRSGTALPVKGQLAYFEPSPKPQTEPGKFPEAWNVDVIMADGLRALSTDELPPDPGATGDTKEAL